MGIVESVVDGTVYTVEGNSGDKVVRRDYPIGYEQIEEHICHKVFYICAWNIIGCQVWLDDPTPCLIIKAGNSENYIW